jgi:hypothetical protein
MSSGERVHEFFYEISIPMLRVIDELVADKFPWQALRRHPDQNELLIAFWAVYEAGMPLPQRKSYVLTRLAYYIGQKPHAIVEEAGRDWPVTDELTALSKPTFTGEANYMAAKTAPKPAPAAAAAKAPTTKVDEKAAQAAAAADAASEIKERKGKAPDGSTWVDWFKKGDAAGKDPAAMRDEYIELRTSEYPERMDVLKRHAYRHLRLALPHVTLPKAVKEPEPAKA